MELTKISLFMIMISNVMARYNSTYNAAELISKILLPQREDFQLSPKYIRHDISQDLSQDVSQDVSQDISQVEYRNRKRRRRPVQRYPDGQTYGNFQQGYPGHFYERPSFASEALSRVTEALTSIALYDDLQCVPRLLCEAGGGALGASTLPGLQPLMTLLSAYGGVSSNPLFVFGRAVLLGMSAKENPGACRYAYPQCPTDPEQLVHYLNNHNGGFFRFFNSPQRGQQNLQQFYNQLKPYQQNNGYQQQNGQQNYGLYQPQSDQQNYGLYQQQSDQQNYGLYQQQSDQQNDVGYGLHNPNPYLNYQSNYGFAYPYNGFGKIQKRIQNKPIINNNDDKDDYTINNIDTKWSFPEGATNEEFNENFEDTRKSKTLRFPDYNVNVIPTYTNYDAQENNRKTRGFAFPNNRNYYVNNYSNFLASNLNTNSFNPVNNNNNNNNFRNENKYNNNFRNENNYNNNFKNENDGYVTVYVVRGNGDPNRPEIVKLRPGETL